MKTRLKPGSIVLHPEFGSGAVVANDGEFVEVDFKLRGRKILTNIAAQSMKESRYKPPERPHPEVVAAARAAKMARRAQAKKKRAEKNKRKKRGKAKTKKRGLQLGPLSGRAGGEKWEWDMTTPNTPLWRNGKR